MVSAEVAGRFEAPIYGMLAVEDAIAKMDWGRAGPPDDQVSRPAARQFQADPAVGRRVGGHLCDVPRHGRGLHGGDPRHLLLVVAQFGSFRLPLVILMPVPLTLIGIVLGHWLLGAAFTATSMIGFIALAGIIVRNSILLVDFIRHRRAGRAAARRLIEPARRASSRSS